MTPYNVSVALALLILLRINISVSLSVKLSAQSLVEPGSAKNDHISNCCIEPNRPKHLLTVDRGPNQDQNTTAYI